MPVDQRSSRLEVFVGRTWEFAQLRDALEEVCDGRGRLFLVHGEPGIGKTSLAEQVARLAQQRAIRALWGRCWEGDGAPAYWPWIQVIRALVGSLDADGRRQLLESERAVPMAETIAQIVPELFARSPRSGQPATPRAPQSQFLLFDSVATLLKDAARLGPIVIFLDDLHDADLASLTMLRFLARELKTTGVLFIGTYREREVQRSPALSGQMGELAREARSLPLAGLTSEEVADFFILVVGRTPDAALARQLYEATAGNPLFIDGIVRGLIAERDRGRDINSYESFSAPHTVREAAARRLANLSDSARAALEVAAAIGNEFDVAICGRVREATHEQIYSWLDEATRDGIVFALGQGRYRFAHPLIRACIYETLDTNSRIRLHGSIGTAIEELYANDQAVHVAELAHHFREAGSGPKAIDYSVRAGSAAFAVYAAEDAIVEWEFALELAGRAGDKKGCAELLRVLGRARFYCGSDYQKGLEQLLAAIELFEKIGRSDKAARARADFGLQLSKDDDEDLTDIDRAWVHFNDAERVLLQLPPGESLGWLYLAMGVACWRSLEVPRGLEITSKGLLLSNQPPDVRASYLRLRAYLLSYNGRIADALALEPVARGLTGGVDLVRQGQCFGEIHWRWWDPTEAVGQLSNVIAGSEKVPPLYRRAVAERLAFAYVMTGELEKARKLLVESPSTSLSGLISLYAGEWTAAERTLRASISKARRTGSRAREADATSWYARLLRASGDSRGARAIFEEGLQTFGDGTLPLVEMWLRPELALLLAANAECDQARLQLVRCREILASGEDWRGLAGHMARAEAAVLASAGKLEEANAGFDSAVSTFRKFALRWEEAETLFLWGRALIAANLNSRGGEKFDAAIELYRRNEAGQRWIDRIEAARKPAAVSRSVDSESAPLLQASFRQEGDYWALAYKSETFRLKDSKGLQYIALLIRNEGREVRADEVAGLGAGADSEHLRHGAPRDVARVASDLGDTGAILDERAKSEYRARMTDIKTELAQAETNNDLGRAEKLRFEIDALERQLTSALGLGGRDRKSRSHTERARWMVTNSIKRAISKIRAGDPALARHLSARIRTGNFCSYTPDPDHPLAWRL